MLLYIRNHERFLLLVFARDVYQVLTLLRCWIKADADGISGFIPNASISPFVRLLDSIPIIVLRTVSNEIFRFLVKSFPADIQKSALFLILRS